MAKNKRKKQIQTHEIRADQVRNPDLKKALENLKQIRTPENEQVMLKALTSANLLIPSRLQGTGQNARTQLVFVHTNDKRTFLPAFTDEQEAKKMKMPDGALSKYIVRHITDLTTIFKNPSGNVEGMVLDPMGVNIILPSKLILALASTQAGDTGAPKKNTVTSSQVQFTEPRIYPTAMVNAVHDAARNLPAIQQIFFKQMINETGAGFALFVKTADGSVQMETAQCLKDAAVPLAKGVQVEILPWNEKLGDTVLKDSVALYDAEFEI